MTSKTKPTIPHFLLPTLKIPFRRRRPTDGTESTTASGSVPKLTSPASPSSFSSAPSSSPDSLFSPRARAAAAAAAAGDDEPSTPATPPDTVARVHANLIRCGTCSAHLAFGSQVVSKGFTGRHGRAFLVSARPVYSASPDPASSGKGSKTPPPQREELLNIRIGRGENRSLVTGMHTVADISCAVCHGKLGWKYLDAVEPSQRYKIGKFILETERIVVYRGWDDADVRVGEGENEPGRDGWREGEDLHPAVVAGEAVEFDSDNEDECDELFAGVWDPVAVSRRRAKGAEGRKK